MDKKENIMWRPKDWYDIVHYSPYRNMPEFEAGANAMLEAVIAYIKEMNISEDINDYVALENDTLLILEGKIDG